MTTKQTFTTGEIAQYCGVTFRTVIRWVERGRLKAYELPGRGDRRIEAPDFVAFLVENKMPVPDELKQYLAQIQQPKVLIVEDDPVMARTIEKALEKAGFETLIARDGFQAGALVGVYSPAVMTLDLNMPGMNGFQVLDTIRNEDMLKHLKVIVISGATPEELQRAVEAGADAALEKPFYNRQLIRTIQELTGFVGHEVGDAA